MSSIELLPLLTASSTKTWKSCARKYYYHYVLRYRSCAPSEARDFGTIMHGAWEAYWRARKRGANNEERWTAAVGALPESLDPYKFAKASAMLMGYCSVWDLRKNIQVLGVERLFRLPLINPDTGHASRTWQLGGKVDVIVRIDGKLAVIEHKTSSEDTEPGSVYRMRLLLDGQVSQYFEGGDEIVRRLGLGDKIDMVVYDISQKPKLRVREATPEEDRRYTKEKSRICPECKKKSSGPAPHQFTMVDDETGEVSEYVCAEGRIITSPGGVLHANQRDRDETPDEYFERCVAEISSDLNGYFQQMDVFRLEAEREEYAWDMWQTAEMIRESRKKNRFPKNPASCFEYHSPCSFWQVCTRQADLKNSLLYRIAAEENEELMEHEDTVKETASAGAT